MKKFYETWTQEEVDEYLDEYNVLVLFKIHPLLKESEVIVHGNMKESQKVLLKLCVIEEFGGKNMSEDITEQINEYAKNWYYRYIERGPIRIINLGKKDA